MSFSKKPKLHTPTPMNDQAPTVRGTKNGMSCLLLFHITDPIFQSSIIFPPQGFLTPASALHPTRPILSSPLTCEQQHQAQGDKVCIGGQEVGHMQRESSL